MPTGIPYCDETLEVTGGCTKCSPGCKNCWAIKEVWRMAHNPLQGDKWKGLVEKKNGILNWTGKIKYFHDALQIPLKRKKPTTYFVNSKADLFHKDVPFEYIDEVAQVILACYRHTFVLLTKRSESALKYVQYMRKRLSEFYKRGEDWTWPSNVHLGVSISNQAEADEKIPILLQIPATVRWLSIEPMLEEIDIKKHLWLRQKCVGEKGCGFTGASYEFNNPKTKSHARCPKCGKNHSYLVTDSIDGIILGGESGKGARPMHPDCPRNIRDQCVAAGVPFYFKQWGEWLSGEEKYTLKINTYQNYYPKRVTRIENTTFFRVGKNKAGRILDGREWNQLPAPA